MSCKCNCGYICNRQCGLPIMKCIKIHYKKDCKHEFNGEQVEGSMPSGVSWASVTCSKCGMSAMEHDMAVGP